MKIQIANNQYFAMIPCLVFGKAIGVTAGVVVRKIGSDTWTSMLIGFLLSMVILWVMIKVNQRFPGKTIIQLSQELLGNPLSMLIGVALILFFALAYTTSVNTVTLHVKHYLLPETPFVILVIAYIVLTMYGVLLGFEVISRFSLFGLIMAGIITVTMIIGTIDKHNYQNMQPLFNHGFIDNLTNSMFTFSDTGMAILAVGMIYPLLQGGKKVMRLSMGGFALGIILVIVWPVVEIATLGADVMKQYVVVCMQQARAAQISIYFPRYELFMVIVWVWAMVVQSCVLFYCAVFGCKQVFNIKEDWMIILPLTAILIVVTYFSALDHNRWVQLITYPWSQFAAGITIGLPLLLFVLSLGKRKKPSGKKRNKR